MYNKYFKNNILPVDKVIMLSRNSAHCKNHLQYLLFDLRITLMNGHAKYSLILFRSIFIVTTNLTISTCLIPQQLKHKTLFFLLIFFFKNRR